MKLILEVADAVALDDTVLFDEPTVKDVVVALSAGDDLLADYQRNLLKGVVLVDTQLCRHLVSAALRDGWDVEV